MRNNIIESLNTSKFILVSVMPRYERKQYMKCNICEKEDARTHKVARTHGKGKEILVIENIPSVTCSHCGESYLKAETLHEIERIKLHKKSFAVKRTIPCKAKQML